MQLCQWMTLRIVLSFRPLSEMEGDDAETSWIHSLSPSLVGSLVVFIFRWYFLFPLCSQYSSREVIYTKGIIKIIYRQTVRTPTKRCSYGTTRGMWGHVQAMIGINWPRNLEYCDKKKAHTKFHEKKVDVVGYRYCSCRILTALLNPYW